MLNHVKIDRFTGGAVTGALFSEEVLYAPELSFTFELMLYDTTIKEEKENTLRAFETSLIDLCKGYLPLGGGVNRGNGTFKGILKKNGEIIYE